MALTSVVVSKTSVVESQPGQWSVTWTLKGFDEAEELFSEDFHEDYKTNDLVSRVEEGFRERMQNYIDKYKREALLLGKTQMDTSLGVVQAALEV
jgi:hypothetical protein